MQRVIDIDENTYNEVCWRGLHLCPRDEANLVKAIKKSTPQPKTGHWEWDQRTGEYVCSECGCNPIYERTTPDVSEIDKYRFCRWCGAPMEVAKE